MNVKLWAGVAVVMLVLTGTGLYMSSNTTEDETVMIVSRVNTEGSGIFADSANYSTIDPLTGDITFTEANIDEWKNKVFATPGVTSIQHMILSNLVNEWGYDFVLKGGSGDSEKGSVYYVILGVADMINHFKDSKINGGIAWEPHYQNVLANSNISVDGGNRKVSYSVATTGALDSNHACCVIAANRSYAQSNGTNIIRFLDAFKDSVDWINDALTKGKANPNDEDFQYLVNIAVEKTLKNDSTTYTPAELDALKQVAIDALYSVIYTYDLRDDNGDGTYTESMKNDIMELVDTYTTINQLFNTVQDLGFQDEAAYANWLVVDDYLYNGDVRRTSDDYADAGSMTIRVGTLVKDIHQIALHVGIDLGIFDDYKITIVPGGTYTAGGEVYNALVTNQVDIGFLGAPPVVLNSINMGA